MAHHHEPRDATSDQGGARAVSYTHLIQYADATFMALPKDDTANEQPDTHAFTAVSYTHLDVYKRQALSLTRKETGILEYLMLNQGRPVSQEELIEHVWDSSVNSFSNATRVHISSLRKKLRSALGYDPIRNRIGEGYVMEDSE